MLIGNTWKSNNLYRGIKHYDNTPLTAKDIHEDSDNTYMKNAYIMDNLLGSGTMNEPTIKYTTTGIKSDSPFVLLLNGDIALINTSEKKDIISNEEIINYTNKNNLTSGVVCVVGWYQHIDSDSTFREYGGVNNNKLDGETLIDENLNRVYSTRYQFRWDIVALSRAQLESTSDVDINLVARDESGEKLGSSSYVTIRSRLSSGIRVATKPDSMSYAYSDIYIIPIIYFKYDGSRFTELKSATKLKPKGVASLVKSSSTPSGKIDEGTMWYDTSTSRFWYYLEGTGFVPLIPEKRLSLMQDTIVIDRVYTNADISLSIPNILSYDKDSDILQVSYEGALLAEDLHYIVDSETDSIKLLGFTTEVGDRVTFSVISIEDDSSTPSSGNLIEF